MHLERFTDHSLRRVLLYCKLPRPSEHDEQIRPLRATDKLNLCDDKIGIMAEISVAFGSS